MSQFCTNCGAPLPDDALFCEMCGTRVESEGTSSGAVSEDPVPSPPPVAPFGEGMKKSGGVPVATIVAGVAVIAVAAGVLFFLRGGKSKGESEETAQMSEVPEVAAEESGGSGSPETDTGSQTANEQAALLEAGVNALTGGVTAADRELIKLPESAAIKEDAGLTDLIGEYEGEIQMTALDGFETIDGVPASFEEERKRILSGPIDCTLEVREDGHWEIGWSMMGSGMSFASKEYASPDEFTPAEIDAMMITTMSGGMYHAKIDKTEEVDGKTMHMGVDHVGAYCTNVDDRMIAGSFLAQMTMYGSDITMQGDFVVHKTTEDYLETQKEELPAAVSSASLGKKAESLSKKNGGTPSSAGSSSGSDSIPQGEAMTEIAKRLSTDESAAATEFDWFIDYVNGTGYGFAEVITDPARATRLTDLEEALNGGWKAFIFTEKGVYGSDVEKYFNAEIEASGGEFVITMNWDLLLEPGSDGSYQETGSVTMRGTYDNAEGTATAASSDSRVDFEDFYLSADGRSEYAVGTYRWISGEVDRIGLMRSSY